MVELDGGLDHLPVHPTKTRGMEKPRPLVNHLRQYEYGGGGYNLRREML